MIFSFGLGLLSMKNMSFGLFMLTLKLDFFIWTRTAVPEEYEFWTFHVDFKFWFFSCGPALLSLKDKSGNIFWGIFGGFSGEFFVWIPFIGSAFGQLEGPSSFALFGFTPTPKTITVLYDLIGLPQTSLNDAQINF